MKIIGVNIDPTSYSLAVQAITTWSNQRSSRYVCIATAHTIMEAYDSPEFQALINHADMVTPDGMPLVWLLKLKGYLSQTRVYGPTLMTRLLERANEENIPIGLFGGSPSTLMALQKNISTKYPSVPIVYVYSPPFTELSRDEDNQICDEITKSDAQILFVGLGCPKQERWIAAHRGRLSLVMLGVGAAFDFHSGMKPQAPIWMQNAGLEWFFRLVSEPRRLWRRYLVQNPRFIILAIADLVGLIH
jgi:N-acetylglucosaminyldiphosphoundecaprenol N-acetyl-beta-D-mannosaminyltransferase